MSKWIFITSFFITSCQGTPYVQGKRLYQQHCESCHMEDGSGLSALIPDLKTSTLLDAPELICLVYTGKKDSIVSGSTYLLREMPSFKHLSATELTNIVNYIRHQWQRPFQEQSILETQEGLQGCNPN